MRLMQGKISYFQNTHHVCACNKPQYTRHRVCVSRNKPQYTTHHTPYTRHPVCVSRNNTQYTVHHTLDIMCACHPHLPLSPPSLSSPHLTCELGVCKQRCVAEQFVGDIATAGRSCIEQVNVTQRTTQNKRERHNRPQE